MAMTPQVKNLKEKFRKTNIRKNTLEALQWFRKMATKIGSSKVNREKFFSSYKKVSKPKQGELLFYAYDPKLKDKLPVYDTYPLIIVLENYKDGFLGLNLHYCPPKVRQLIILQLAGTTNFENHKARQVNYQIVKVIMNSQYLRVMIKRYLYTHLRSPLVKIPESQWDIIPFLPLAKFHKKSKHDVWKGLPKA